MFDIIRYMYINNFQYEKSIIISNNNYITNFKLLLILNLIKTKECVNNYYSHKIGIY